MAEPTDYISRVQRNEQPDRHALHKRAPAPLARPQTRAQAGIEFLELVLQPKIALSLLATVAVAIYALTPPSEAEKQAAADAHAKKIRHQLVYRPVDPDDMRARRERRERVLAQYARSKASDR